MTNEEKRKIMDSLTREQLAGIAEIIRSADVEGDYTGMDSDGGSFWQENVSATLTTLAWYFDGYDSSSVIE